MKERNINGVQLAQMSNISKSALNDFLLDKSTPSFNAFLKLLNFFNCSADYLLGREDILHDEKFYEALPFHVRLRQILNDYKISQEQLKRDLHVSGSVVYKWISGKSKPSMHTLILLADYFDCSVDYLIGRVR